MRNLLLRYTIILTALFPPVTNAGQDLPRQVVEQAASNMTSRLISDKETIKTQDYYLELLVNNLLLPAVDHIHMAKHVLGDHWKRASGNQQKVFTMAFKHKVIRTYAKAFKAFNGETIRYENSKKNQSGSQALVKSQIILKNGSNIGVDYRLYFQKGQWRIFDIIIENASLVKTFHEQVMADIKKTGLAQTISKLASEYKNEAPVIKLGAHSWGHYLGIHLPNFGLAADIVISAYAKAGYLVDIDFMPWKRIFEEIKDKKLDGSIATWVTEERRKSLLFSDPYLTNSLVFIKRKNDPFIYQNKTHLESFVQGKGYRLGLIEDYSYGPNLRDIKPFFNHKTREYCSQLFRDIASKNLDVALVDRWVAETELNDSKKIRISEHLVVAPGVLDQRSLHITFPANGNSEILIKAFNKGLKRLKADGSYQKILKKHHFPL